MAVKFFLYLVAMSKIIWGIKVASFSQTNKQTNKQKLQVGSIPLPFSPEKKLSWKMFLSLSLSLSLSDKSGKANKIPYVKEPESVLFISSLHYLHLYNLRHQ